MKPVTKLRRWVRRHLRRRGVDVVRYRDPMNLLGHLIKETGFQTVLDVGANKGEYSEFIRKAGFTGHIVAFEPMKRQYMQLVDRFSEDVLWAGNNVALSSRSGEGDLYVASNDGASSSLLEMEERHETGSSGVRMIARESVTITTLSCILKEYAYPSPIFLKLDTQGTELDVLRGAEDLLGTSILGVQVELSIVPLYRKGCRMSEVVSFVEGHGFLPVWASSGFTDAISGDLLQLDIMYLHSSLLLAKK